MINGTAITCAHCGRRAKAQIVWSFRFGGMGWYCKNAEACARRATKVAA